MGGMQAAMTLVQIQEAALEKKGHPGHAASAEDGWSQSDRARDASRGASRIDKKEHEEPLASIKKSYDDKTESATPPAAAGSTPSSTPSKPARSSRSSSTTSRAPATCRRSARGHCKCKNRQWVVDRHREKLYE